MATFPATPAASQQSSGEAKTNTEKVQFGDGYSVRIPLAINNVVEKFPLLWKSITKTEKDTLVDFLKARNGSESFDYTLPDESTPKKFICNSWRWTYGEYNLFDLHATFEQVFEA